MREEDSEDEDEEDDGNVFFWQMTRKEYFTIERTSTANGFMTCFAYKSPTSTKNARIDSSFVRP